MDERDVLNKKEKREKNPKHSQEKPTLFVKTTNLLDETDNGSWRRLDLHRLEAAETAPGAAAKRTLQVDHLTKWDKRKSQLRTHKVESKVKRSLEKRIGKKRRELVYRRVTAIDTPPSGGCQGWTC